MIEFTSHGEVQQIRLSRYPDFPVATWVCAYLIDGLLIDTGPAYTAQELTAAMADRNLKLAVNTGQKPAFRLYEGFGFITTNTRSMELGDGLTVQVAEMEKRLVL